MQILSLRKIHLLPLMKNSHTFIFHTGSCQERCPSQICVGSFQLPQCPSAQTHLQKKLFFLKFPLLFLLIFQTYFFLRFLLLHLFAFLGPNICPLQKIPSLFSPFFFSFKISLCRTIQNIFLASQVLQQATQSKRVWLEIE